MSSDRVRVVLHNGVDEHELVPLASTHRWFLDSRIPKNGDQPREYIYRTDDENTAIHWIEDHKIGVTYILVDGPEATSIAKLLHDKLETFSSADILARAQDKKLKQDDRRLALYHLALDKIEHGFDKLTFELYEGAMADSAASIRGAAVLGSAYLGWKQLAKPMKPLTTAKETDASVRADAATLVARLQKL